MFGLLARDVDARDGALEAVALARQFDRDERAAGPAQRRTVEPEPEIGQHAAQLSRFAFVALLQLRQRDCLAVIEAIQRCFDARKLGADIAVLAALATGRCVIGLERRAAVARLRRCHRAGRRRTSRGSDRACRQRIADADQRRRVRFQRRLAAHQVVKLLLELLLVEQLAAGGAVDAGAQFGDAVLVGVLLLGLPRDQASEEIVAESEIGRGRDRPAGHDDDGADKDPKRDRSEPDLPSRMGDGVARASATAWLPLRCARIAWSGLVRDLPRLSRSRARH